jgi:hypothetical protein
VGGNIRDISKERREIMKTKKHFILVVVAFVLVARLLTHATMSDAQDQSGPCNKGAFPSVKITDRHAFLEGVFFAKQEIREMRLKEALDAPCEKKDILAGLEGIQVLAEGVKPEAEKCGLTQKILQTDAELRLRQHGIMILTLEDVKQSLANDRVEGSEKDIETLIPKAIALRESLAGKDSDEHFLQCLRDFILHGQQQTSSLPPCLYINVNVIVFEESHHAVFSIEVGLKEGASLDRNAAFCEAPIWEMSGVAGCSSNNLKEYVREGLRDYLDEFINDYLAANPKDQSSDIKQ